MEITKQQAFDIYDGSADIGGKEAKKIATQGEDHHRWYIHRDIIFSLDGKFYSFGFNTNPKSEMNGLDDINDEATYGCTEVGPKEKVTIEYVALQVA